MAVGAGLWITTCVVFRFPKIVFLIGAVPAAIVGVVAMMLLFLCLDKRGKL